MNVGAFFIDGRPILHRVWRADRWPQRLRGLLGRKPLEPGEGLWLLPCGHVHTMAMSMSLDLLFLDRQQHVLGWRQQVRPWSSAGCRHAHSTVEMCAGSLEAIQPEVGQPLLWRSE